MNRLCKLSLVALVVAACPFASSAVRAQDAAQKDPVVVPFQLVKTGHFLVKVELNDKGPYQLIFDTGAPTMLINNRIARDSGVITDKSPRPLFAPFGSMGQFNIDKMKIGELSATDVKTMVMDHPTVGAFSRYFEKEYGPIDGIVGFPFFARYTMSVDYKKEELTFVPNGYEPADVMQSMMRTLLTAGARSEKPDVVGASAHWGLVVDKAAADEDPGVDIIEVRPGSPAAEAGLKKGDRLLTIDGRWTDSEVDTHRAAGYAKPGQQLSVVVERGGEKQTFQVTPTAGL